MTTKTYQRTGLLGFMGLAFNTSKFEHTVYGLLTQKLFGGDLKIKIKSLLLCNRNIYSFYIIQKPATK